MLQLFNKPVRAVCCHPRLPFFNCCGQGFWGHTRSRCLCGCAAVTVPWSWQRAGCGARARSMGRSGGAGGGIQDFLRQVRTVCHRIGRATIRLGRIAGLAIPMRVITLTHSVAKACGPHARRWWHLRGVAAQRLGLHFFPIPWLQPFSLACCAHTCCALP